MARPSLKGTESKSRSQFRAQKEIHFIRNQKGNATEYGRRWKRYIFLAPTGRIVTKFDV